MSGVEALGAMSGSCDVAVDVDVTGVSKSSIELTGVGLSARISDCTSEGQCLSKAPWSLVRNLRQAARSPCSDAIEIAG